MRGLIVLDRDERITRWNVWMEAASGHSRSSAHGKLLTDVFSGVDLKRLTPAIKAALTSSASTIVTHAINPSLLPLQTRSKMPLLHDITVTPVGGAPAAGCLVLITDVTMAVRRERYLRDRQNARYDAVVANAARCHHHRRSGRLDPIRQPGRPVPIRLRERGIVGKIRDRTVRHERSSGERLCRPRWPTRRPASPSISSHGARTERSATWKLLRRFGPAARAASSPSSCEMSMSGARRTSRCATARQRHAMRRCSNGAQPDSRTARARSHGAADADRGGAASEPENGGDRSAYRAASHMISITSCKGITGGLDLVKKRVMQGRFSELDRFISGAMASANRASALTHRLLAFSRRQPLAPKAVEVNPLLASMEELLRRTLGEHVTLELVTAGGLWLTKCDPNQLENAVLNLVINARDAMPDGGTLTVETGMHSWTALTQPSIRTSSAASTSVSASRTPAPE